MQRYVFFVLQCDFLNNFSFSKTKKNQNHSFLSTIVLHLQQLKSILSYLCSTHLKWFTFQLFWWYTFGLLFTFKCFSEYRNSLKDNVEIYVTGSNSKFLSSDIATDFRGRSDEIHMYPLSFSEFLSAYDGNENDALLE